MRKRNVMAQKDYTVEGRQFRTEGDYTRALQDKKIIDALRSRTDMRNRVAVERLQRELSAGKYRFHTILGQDFAEEVDEALRQAVHAAVKGGKGAKRTRPPGSAGGKGDYAGAPRGRESSSRRKPDGKIDTRKEDSPEMKAIIQEELKRQEKRRRLAILLCSVAAVGCLGYFGIYSWYNYRTGSDYDMLSELKEQPVIADVTPPPQPLYTLDEEQEPKEVLDEYKNLLIKNKRLIGWVKIDDTNIDYPVVQTSDNEYYLSHNMEQEYDKNGTIFLDKDCDVLKPSTNFIIYGHHMKSGKMFGKLDLYEKEDYYREHPQIQFDTIYEKGIYEIMYVFRSRVYKEDEIVFKYYQFIDANSEREFDSYMEEMAAMSLYDTGVTAEYGDQLLTLSTCDEQERNGRFVVVAKKIKE